MVTSRSSRRRATLLLSARSPAAHHRSAWASSRRSRWSTSGLAIPALREWLEKRFRDLDRPLQRSRSPFWLTSMKGDETRVRLATLGYDDLLAIVRALEQPRKVRLCLVHVDSLHPATLTKSSDLG